MLMRRRRSLALSLILSLLLWTVSCGSADINTVIKYTQRALPLLSAAGVDLANAQQVIDLANQFQADPQAATLAAITLAFDRVIAQAQGIPDQGKRTVVLVALVAANIALHELADKYLALLNANPGDPRLGAPRERMTLSQRARRKPWACRNSQTGKFEKMRFCEKNPSISTVETR
jgi:hypothetical protein